MEKLILITTILGIIILIGLIWLAVKLYNRENTTPKTITITTDVGISKEIQNFVDALNLNDQLSLSLAIDAWEKVKYQYPQVNKLVQELLSKNSNTIEQKETIDNKNKELEELKSKLDDTISNNQPKVPSPRVPNQSIFEPFGKNSKEGDNISASTNSTLYNTPKKSSLRNSLKFFSSSYSNK